MNFNNKVKKNNDDMKNWYSDRYASISIQRNFLIIFSIIVAMCTFVCLLIIKSIQDGEDKEPYLIEYDKSTGYMTIVETKSKKEYTAQQIVKESMIIQYINRREAPKFATLEDDMNYVRVMSSDKLYDGYTKSVLSVISALRKQGANAKYSINIKSLTYLSANRLKIKFNRILKDDNDQVVSSDEYDLTTTFGFIDNELSVDERMINPLGFQVTSYNLNKVKTYESSLNVGSDNNNL